MCRQFASAKRKVRPLVFVASYEAPKTEMRERAMGYAATIHRDTLSTMRSVTRDLSRRGSLKDYEKKYWRQPICDGQPVPGELERFKAAKAILEDHIVFWDMTGSDPNMPGAGQGGVDELSTMIDAHLRAHVPEYHRSQCAQ